MTNVRQQLLLALGASLSLTVAACGGDDGGPTCGAGTSEVDGACVPDSTVTCGTGTRLEGGTCVPTAVPVAAPTVSAVTPVSDLIGGGQTFTLTGTGFSGGGNLTVTFGTATATFTVVNDTTITGTVPAGLARSAPVTVTNSAGTASTPFRYTGLFAADGRGGVPGKLYLVDPRGTYTLTIGAVADGGGAGHGVTGMEFAPDGTLYATEATNYGRITGAHSNLLRIDTATGAATVIGELKDSVTDTVFHDSIADITFSGTTLLGWTEETDDACTIDLATGVVTALPDSANGSAGDGMVTRADGTVLVATDGANADLWSLDTTTGQVTSVATLATPNGDSNDICAATIFQGTMYGLLCNGSGATFSTTRLVTIDPATGEIALLGTVPPGVDSLASDEQGALTAGPFVPPARPDAPEVAAATRAAAMCSSADLSLAHVTRGAGALATLRADQLATSADSIAVKGKTTSTRGLSLRSAVGRTTAASLDVVSCDGFRKTIVAADLANYALVPNQRGHIKVVDVRTGARIARDVTALELR